MKLYLLFLVLLFCQKGNCCSCIHPGNIDEKQFNKYDLIFKGKVEKIYEKAFERIIFLKVEAYYKGKQISKISKIISPAQSGQCGIFPKIGEHWLMFAYSSGKTFNTNLCTRTKNMNPKAWDYDKDGLENDLKFLKKKRKIAPSK
ncbi:hypothetical protein [Ferruginibacter sp.]